MGRLIEASAAGLLMFVAIVGVFGVFALAAARDSLPEKTDD